MKHMVAMPYPGRGHINPMMNLCNLLSIRLPATLITFVITEEWLGIIGSDPKPVNLRLATIPNVIPSEIVRGANMPNFIDAVMTKMEQPFAELIDRLDLPANLIVADTFLPWVVHIGNRRNIPVASFWTMSAAMFSLFYHFELIVKNHNVPVELSERGEDKVDYIPGLSPLKVADLPTLFNLRTREFVRRFVDCFHLVNRTQFLLLTTVYELEIEAIEAVKAKFNLPVYTLGPNIANFKQKDDPSIAMYGDKANYFKWLDVKAPESVLYVSLGSFFPVSSLQMDEISAGLKESGVNYLLVVREETHRLSNYCAGGEGLVVQWCDQFKVLCHPSVGGFLTHCGWNSVKESIFAGVPMLTFPLVFDQVPNSKFVVADWQNGWKIRKEWWTECLVKREEIAEVVRKFMDLQSAERKEMMKKAKDLKEICQHSVEEGGSAYKDVNAFIGDISR